MMERLDVGRALDGSRAGSAPVVDRLRDQPPSTAMLGDGLRLGLDNVGEALHQHGRDALVMLGLVLRSSDS
jgi:hypothetical protein